MELLVLKAADASDYDEEPFRERFERSLARKLWADWAPAARRAVDSGVAAFRNGARPATIVRAVGKVLRGYPDRVDQTIAAQTEIYYRGAATRFLRDFEEHGPVEKGVVTTAALAGGGKLYAARSRKRFVRKARIARGEIDFQLRDQKAIRALSELTVNAASRYFPEQLQDKVAAVVADVVFNEGLSTAEAAKRLEVELSGALGSGSLAAAELVPPRFATNPQAYFRILSGQAATLANSVGRILSMDDAGVEKFEIVAVIDEKTSGTCRALNGRVITVGEAVATVERLLEFTGVRQIEQLLPFAKKGAAAAPAWASSIGFPPYHHGPCRTQIIPVVE